MSLVQHIETCFGRIQHGWTDPEDATEKAGGPRLNIVECRGGMVEGITVVSTLGLSHHSLKSVTSEKLLRQELFLMMKNDQFSPRAPAILRQVAEERIQMHGAVLRGEVVRKPGSFGGGDFVALYATVPIYYPADTWSYLDARDGAVILSWVLPIKEDESSYVEREGWSKFETRLNQAEFDLFDCNRKSVLN